jgi:hypothetical protein
MIRHAKKNENDMSIAPGELNQIEKNGIPCLNGLIYKEQHIYYHCGSGFERTQLTMQALKKYLAKSGYDVTLILPADIRFGNESVRNRMLNNKDLVALKKIKGWYQALVELEPDFLEKILLDLRQALQDVLNQIDEDSLTIIISHKPMIEFSAVAEDINFDRSTALKELEGVLFIAENNLVTSVKKIK